MKATEYLAAVKTKLHISSDYALAKALKVSKQTAAKYSAGEVVPGPVVAFRVAEILGEQPAAVIADFEQERAERDGRADEAAELKEWVRRLGGAAASILLALGLGGFPNADARLAQPSHVDHDIHRVKRRRRKAGPFDGLMSCMAIA